jgi:hypothetical protein
MAQGSYNLGGDEVREESSWRYPLIIFFATLILCVIFLYHYVGPDVDEIQGNKPRPTINDERIVLNVGDITMSVPANYTVFPRDRRPGDRESISLYASWPRMEGYVPARRDDFVENRRNSRRIDMLVEVSRTPFSEAERLEILYLPHTVDPEGGPFEHELTRYTFRQGSNLAPASGYSDKEMFIGTTEDGEMAVLFCYIVRDDSVPPDCFREFDLTEQVAIKYYFKRPYLPEWKKIDARVRELLGEFRVR